MARSASVGLLLLGLLGLLFVGGVSAGCYGKNKHLKKPIPDALRQGTGEGLRALIRVMLAGCWGAEARPAGAACSWGWQLVPRRLYAPRRRPLVFTCRDADCGTWHACKPRQPSVRCAPFQTLNCCPGCVQVPPQPHPCPVDEGGGESLGTSTCRAMRGGPGCSQSKSTTGADPDFVQLLPWSCRQRSW